MNVFHSSTVFNIVPDPNRGGDVDLYVKPELFPQIFAAGLTRARRPSSRPHHFGTGPYWQRGPAVRALLTRVPNRADRRRPAARCIPVKSPALVTAPGTACGALAPLLEPSLLPLPRFGAVSTGTFVFGIAFAVVLLSNVLWRQDVRRWSALHRALRRCRA
ncbi:hypothetical protein E4K10_04085 [Streptomyces sp. T1317-0309]|nr:hypothetical protein E4K10_04085 [Streptomyces sp. T1317-0309]